MSRPIGSGPGGPTVDRSSFEKHWSDRPIRLVAMQVHRIISASSQFGIISIRRRSARLKHPNTNAEQKICVTLRIPCLNG